MPFATERKQLLAEAHRARNAGRQRRAIALYRRLLREDPHDVELALRVAPLLARRGESFEAWQHFRDAARTLARRRRFEDCLTVYREACRAIPREYEAWRLRAELELRLGREATALETLLDARVYFRDVGTRGQAIALLTRARALEPWDLEIVLDLALLYARTDQTDAALELLTAMAARCDPEDATAARRIRSLQWRITLSPRFAWLWLHAWYDGWGRPTDESNRSEERDATVRARRSKLDLRELDAR